MEFWCWPKSIIWLKRIFLHSTTFLSEYKWSFFFLLEYSWFTVLCQFLLYSIVAQSYIYAYVCTFFSYTIFQHVLSPETGYSFLYCKVGPHCLSILNIIVCTYQPQTPRPSFFLPLLPWQPQVWTYLQNRLQVEFLLFETRRTSTNNLPPRTCRDSHPSCSHGGCYPSSGFLPHEPWPISKIINTTTLPIQLWLVKESWNTDER